MTLDIAAIKARADAATDARFSLSATYFDHVTNMWLSGVHIDGHAVSGPAIAIKGNSVEFCNALRAFIAHARTDIPALLAALEASEAARVKAEQERDALKERENISDELMASQYRAGAQAGWNAAQLIWPKSQEAIARLTQVNKGDLQHIQAANARRALESKP